MMGFSCMKAVYEYTRYPYGRKILLLYCARHSGVSLTKNPASQQTNTIKKLDYLE